jgi:hypothetical protein
MTVTVLGIYAKGYAGATMGGVSYMLNLKEEEIQGVKNPVASVLYENDTEKVIIRLCSRLIMEDGRVTHWGEDKNFNSHQKAKIKKWIEDNSIIEDAKHITKRYKENFDELMASYDELKKHYEKRVMPRDAHYEGWTIIKEELQAKLDTLRAESDALKETVYGLPVEN